MVIKSRLIAYASHLDSHVFAYYSDFLAKRLELVYASEACGSSVLAYRALGKSNIDFANAAFDDIGTLAPCVAKAFDITGFFDNMSHHRLKSAWASILGERHLPSDHYAVFNAISRFARVDRDQLYSHLGILKDRDARNFARLCNIRDFRERIRACGLIEQNRETRGIPQGSPISAVLSNVYMLEFDRRMMSLAETVGAKYWRYCDDILFVCPLGTDGTIETAVYHEIKFLELEAQPEKTDTATFKLANGQLVADKPLQYLGFTFDGRRRRIRSQTLAKFYRRARRAVRAAKRTALERGEHHKVFKRRIYERFTHLGKRNFLSYTYRAARRMNDNSIRRQLARHWDRIQKMLADEQE